MLGPGFFNPKGSTSRLRLLAGKKGPGLRRAGRIKWSEPIVGMRWEGRASGNMLFIVTAVRKGPDSSVFELRQVPSLKARTAEVRKHADSPSPEAARRLAESLLDDHEP